MAEELRLEEIFMQTTHEQSDEVRLLFEFASANGSIKPLLFTSPYKIITAGKIEEVVPCLELIHQAVKEGYYAAGFLSYESAPAFDTAFYAKTSSEMPLLWFGLFFQPSHEEIKSIDSYSVTKWKPSVNEAEYREAIRSIKNVIQRGETYQVNYTIRLNSCFKGDAFAFFKKLKKAQSSNYCAYINTGTHHILSASPELFFHMNEDEIITRPMKGTIKRGYTFLEDEEHAKWLYHSKKNRAENVMIVDMLRNDLSVIAAPGTVEAIKLFEIEKYPTVYQMTSTVRAKLSKETKVPDIFKALFPAASITGAPKAGTMKVIEEFETQPRGIYCGAIGYITPSNEAVFNVPIRTVVIEQKTGKAVCGVGGGITSNSTANEEFDEVIAKAKFLQEDAKDFQLIETILLENGEYFLLEEHLIRLKNSACYFDFFFAHETIVGCLTDHAKRNNNGKYKLRLLLNKKGEVSADCQPVQSSTFLKKVLLADKSVDKNNPFLYHKTTERSVYSAFQRKQPENIFDTLLWNEEKELTEFTNGNLVLEINGQFLTPFVNSGLLAGTFRDRLIRDKIIFEKKLTRADIKSGDKIWFINSVRKWVQVQLIN
jgi:para-aminobenzoate synthetase/4-amino-4-deoxychorismate lyase